MDSHSIPYILDYLNLWHISACTGISLKAYLKNALALYTSNRKILGLIESGSIELENPIPKNTMTSSKIFKSLTKLLLL